MPAFQTIDTEVSDPKTIGDFFNFEAYIALVEKQAGGDDLDDSKFDANRNV